MRPDRAGRPVRADGAGAELDRALALGGAGWRARMLATVPSNLKNPAWLADQARELPARSPASRSRSGTSSSSRPRASAASSRVGKASATPPRLVRLDYTPRRRPAGSRATVVLVGKGITFDTGGLSIKPAEGMST